MRKSVSYLTGLRADVSECQMNISELADIIDTANHELTSLTPETVRTEQDLVDETTETLARACAEMPVQLDALAKAVRRLREFF